MLLSNQATLQIGLETTAGVDPTLATTTGILAKNITIDPSQGKYDDGQKADADFGANADDWSGKYMTMTFDIPFAGAGAAGTAPGYGVILKACDWSETVTAGVKVVYATQNYNRTTSKSVAIYYNKGGLKFTLLNGRGTVSPAFSANGKPMLKFSFTGLWSKPTDTPLPDINTAKEAFLRGIEMNKANTTFSFHGITPVLNSLDIDQGNTVVFSDLPNGSAVDITGRSMSGKITFEYPPVATFDVSDRAAKNTLGALSLTHGTVAGNIVKVDGLLTQIKQPKLTDIDGKVFCQADLAFIRAATGNGELTLTVQ
jgi:hypothetical protein